MSQAEVPIQQSKGKVSTPALIIGGILAVSGLFLFIPSSQASRSLKAKDKLAKEFAGPKDLSNLLGGFLVTIRNQPVELVASDRAEILFFAPGPKDEFSSNLMSQLDPTYMYGGSGTIKTACLLAPDPACADLTLFAKVWLAMSIHTGVKQQIASSLGPSLATSGYPGGPSGLTTMHKSAVAQLRTMWLKLPKNVQKMADEKLESNRKIAAGSHGVHRYYQNSKGTNYEIDASNNFWEFMQTYHDAYPGREPEF